MVEKTSSEEEEGEEKSASFGASADLFSVSSSQKLKVFSSEIIVIN